MIVPMTQVRIFGPKELLDRTISLLYEMGSLHPEPLPPDLVSRVSVPDRRTDDREAAHERVALETLYEKVHRSLILLPVPAAGESKAPAPPVTSATLHDDGTRKTVDDLFSRIERLSGTRKGMVDRIALLSRYQKMVSAVLPLVERAGDLAHLEMVGLTVAREQRGMIGILEGELRKATDGMVQVFSAEVDDHTVAALVLYGLSDAPKVRALLWDRNLSELKLPSEIERLPLQHALAEIAAQGESLPRELRAVDKELAALAAAWEPYLSALGDELSARLRQLGTRSSFFRTRHSFVIAGWIPRDDLPRLRSGVAGIAGGRILVEEAPTSRADEARAPVHLRNHPLIRPFEVFLRLLPLPSYRSLDPTPLLAVFFPLFFGLIVGDVGYGLLIAALAFLLRRRFPARSQMRDLLTVILSSTAAAVLFGLVFGEFFGTLGESFGMKPLHPNLNRLEAIPFFLGLSVGIGCLHVFLGLGLGVANAVRAGHPAGVRHRLGQAAALAGLILVIAALAGMASRQLLAPAAALLVGGLALWIAGEGFAAPIELVSTAGNVLSYARIMAVGLAGVVLAMVANEMGRRSLWGLLAAVVLHLINLVLCVFSPTIHAMRLHLVEFFTKFYETGGAAYKPLSRREGA